MTNLTKILLLAGAGAAIWFVPTILALMNMSVHIISVLPTNIQNNIISFQVTVKIKNNSRFRVNMEKIIADVILNGLPIAKFEQIDQYPILPYGEQNVLVNFSIDVKQVGDELWTQLLAQNLQNFVLDVKGYLTANSKTLPFDSVWTIQDVKNSL
jgi:LEA14-like dessication related protein